MATQIYGASDDLIEFEGDVRGEAGCYGNHATENGVLLMCSDGTALSVKYGGKVSGVWAISLLKHGANFLRIDQCVDSDAERYSDTAHFVGGLKWVYAAKEWELVE